MFYDGTVEGSNTDSASYIDFPNDTITFSTASTFQPRDTAVNFQDPALMMKKLGRIFVPRLWVPEGATI